MLQPLVEQMAAAHLVSDWEENPLHKGLSALILEILFGHLLHNEDAAGEYREERIRHLSIAGENRAAFDREVRLFVLPAVQRRGDVFLIHLRDALKEHLRIRHLSDLHRHITLLHAAKRAFREARLPDSLWLYIEPQLDRHGEALGMELTGFRGRAKKALIRAALTLA